MNALQNTKLVMVTPPAAIADNVALTCAAIDRRGFDYAQVIVIIGATDIAMVTCKVRESDDDSSYSDVTGLVVGASTTIDGSVSALPSATDDNKFVVFDIDLRGRKRYLKPSITVGDGVAGTYCTVIALLSRAQEPPSSSAKRGALAVLRV